MSHNFRFEIDSTLTGLAASEPTQGRRFAPTLGCMIPTPLGLAKSATVIDRRYINFFTHQIPG